MSYDPVDSLDSEVKRFFKTNTFTAMEVTNFYMQARLVLTELAREQDARTLALHERDSFRGDRDRLREALEKISAYHFDAKHRVEGYACGGGCDMGESGRTTDERGHDFDCIFGVATKALAAVTPSTQTSGDKP
jgi:hypothetical protein